MAERKDIAIEFEKSGRRPVFLDIAMSIVSDIERGRLKPGDALPGTRTLAKSLNVHRNTVDAAFHELTMQGWLVSEPSRGTFVARDLPVAKPGGRSTRVRMHSPNPDAGTVAVSRPPVLRVSDGAPDPRIMPRVELSRAFRRAMTGQAFLTDAGYGDPRGAPALRVALSGYLARERGLATSPDELMVTRGSQMELFLAAAAIVEPGQVIAVETPGYPLAWSAFRAAGARVIGVPVDGGGLDIDHLARLAEREPALRAIYVTPHHQYPTTATMGAGRRLKLLDIARHHGLFVIEDDYDHEYRFDGRPILPLAARADPDVPVIYIGSLSKLLAPVVRLGYVVARPDILTRMADRREAIDRQGDLPLELALATLMDDGELGRHARKARRIYEGRRNLMADELCRSLGDSITFDLPAGGLAIWLRLQSALSAETWAANAARAGLVVSPGLRFTLDAANAPQAFRIGYANFDDAELRQLVSLLAESKPRLTR